MLRRVRVSEIPTWAESRAKVMWIPQGETANPLQKRLAGKVENFQVVGDSAGPGRLENVVMLARGITVRACAACQPASATRTAVTIDDVRIELGPFKCNSHWSLKNRRIHELCCKEAVNIV